MPRPGLLVPIAVLALCAAPLHAQDGRWHPELPGANGIDFLAPLPPLPSHLHSAWPSPPLVRQPDQVRALYVNAWAFGGSRFRELIRLADETEVNALVIDIKDDTGYLTYPSKVPTAIAIGANREVRARDTEARVREMLAHGIYPIARIVVAKDPLLAERKPAWAIQSRNGGLWRDRKGTAWVDAFNDSVWVYATQLAAEAVRMGFAEVQFDYVRFPDEPRARMASAVFPARRAGESTRQGVQRNLQLVRTRMAALEVPVTLDVFGMTTVMTGDMGIGQVWEDLVSSSDVVLPMVYPSHYAPGMYGASSPNAEPYLVVRRALEDGLRRSALVDRPASIRPYLQAFTLGAPRYSGAHVRAQIQAAADVGIDSWVLWNPRSDYREAGLAPTRLALGSQPVM
ncbi:MAG TPA: putative glycoside hydrolase [Gemmatimonadales bacterium]|nr:putative glycoside hydrolase [Gemmatimonadales bacterium]